MQASHLFVGRGNPVGVDRSRFRWRNTCRARFGTAPSSIPRGRTRCPHAPFHGQARRWPGRPRRRASSPIVEERRHCRCHDAGQRASRRAQLRLFDSPWPASRTAGAVRRQGAERRRGRRSHSRRSGVAALFETNQVVDADPGESGDLFSAQTRGAPAAAVGQADVGRLQLLAAGPEELGQSRHTYSMPDRPANRLALPVPGSARPSRTDRDKRIMEP